MFIFEEEEPAVAWDCDPDYIAEPLDRYQDLDETDDAGDWQVIVLERFHDRLVDDTLSHRGDASTARCW